AGKAILMTGAAVALVAIPFAVLAIGGSAADVGYVAPRSWFPPSSSRWAGWSPMWDTSRRGHGSRPHLPAGRGGRRCGIRRAAVMVPALIFPLGGVVADVGYVAPRS